MAQNQDIIVKLIEKLEQLYKKQADFNNDINSLKDELYKLKSGANVSDSVQKDIESIGRIEPVKQEQAPIPEHIEPVKEIIKPISEPKPEVVTPKQEPESVNPTALKPINPKPIRPISPPKSKSNIEKFIGENILNKIGIVITIIGVAIGAKYSIENDLISPLTRIILGYLTAIGLLGFGIKLKKNYESFSAVLVSGSIVILYFITFFAYNFYELIPQLFTFALMVVFTIFTIVAAISYNRQIIALLGLVGAYAIPFLLSNDSGRVEILFSYIALINVGILILAFKKYWKSLYYSAFIFTWLIFASWFGVDYDLESHFTIAFLFLSIFFVMFYVIFMAYKMIRKEAFGAADVIMLMVNSFIFYGFGYAIINSTENGAQLLGLFTLGNAIIHFITTAIIYNNKLADRNLFYLASGMVLIFLTLTVPIQLDGNWVTLLWIGEAALLFWIGRTKQVSFYEKLSYILVVLALFSLFEDWDNAYNSYYGTFEEALTPLFNINFLTSAIFISGIAFILFIHQKQNYKSAFNNKGALHAIISYSIPTILVVTLYYAFRLEIEMYWEQLFKNSVLETNTSNSYTDTIKNYDLRYFETIWILNYSLLFIGLLSLFNAKFIKNKALKYIALSLLLFSLFTFLTVGLYTLSELRESYLNPSEYYDTGIYYLIIRYISFAFLAFTLFICYRFIKQENTKRSLKTVYDLVLHISIVWVLSSELIHWLDLSGSSESYKLGLSILWGVYSFLLIAFGIWKNKKHLRIGGIGLFGITLIKLFFYDIANLDTISKTIVFVSLGILLLVISFLYNKFTNKITDHAED